MSDTNGLDVAIEVVGPDEHQIACVRPAGEVDLANADEFDAALSSPEAAQCQGILLDLREVGFMDSSGLRVVLSHAQAGGARFATILEEGSAVAGLFEMVGVTERINVAPTEDEAISKLRAAADAAG